jgi:hypothetical protein
MPNQTDSTIVRAAIHPGIGIARIGNSQSGYFIGPEIATPQPQGADYYRDPQGSIKRQAARFRIYGYNAAGEVVRELTADDADVVWTVHVANRKAQWYRFTAALDIPESANAEVIRRNADFADRTALAIDPGSRSITGKSVSGGDAHAFNTGTFKGKTVVPLGEIRTDEAGRLLFLGGTGLSASPSGAPIFIPTDGDSFNNANDWYDDTSDGPVTASVAIGGKDIPVDPAWVVVAPPNYGPDMVSWRTMYDLLCDLYIGPPLNWRKPPNPVSFTDDVLPILQRLSNLQWVNKGYATMFGKGCPMDFHNPDFIGRLACQPASPADDDIFKELRQSIYNMFRPLTPTVAEPVVWPHVWPWIYGDAYGSYSAFGPGNMLTMTQLQQTVLQDWVENNFKNDWPPKKKETAALDAVPVADQPAMLDQAALHFCLADTFHPGCEMTWPMRHTTMYAAPFRIRQRPSGQTEPDYGPKLSAQQALAPDGPLNAQGPGDITRWMALPWQGDTAFCRSGYDPEYDPYLPTFWAARVPNGVLDEDDYATVIDTALPREQRLAAFNRRMPWTRAIDVDSGNDTVPTMMNMVAHFGMLGIVEARPGVKDDKDFPEVIYVETIAAKPIKEKALLASRKLKAIERQLTRVELAGWTSEEQFRAFRSVRVRHE